MIPDKKRNILSGNFVLKIRRSQITAYFMETQLTQRFISLILMLFLVFIALSTDIAALIEREAERENRLVYEPIPEGFELMPGKYELEWDPEVRIFMYLRPIITNEEATSFIKKLPNLKSEKPIIELHPLDDSETHNFLAVVYDESDGTGKGYDTAYIDTNRNFDLSDEQPVKWEIPTGRITKFSPDKTFSPWITVQACYDPENPSIPRHPIQIRVEAMVYGGDSMLQLERKGGWKGTIQSSAGEIECVTVDFNSNGRYGDQVKNEEDISYSGAKFDFIFADTNGAGKVILRTFGSHVIPLSNPVLLAGKLYSITTSAWGDYICIEKFDGPTGNFAVEIQNIKGLKGIGKEYLIAGKQSLYKITDHDGKPFELATGKYRITSLGLELKSNDETLWLRCQIDETIEVTKDKTATLNIGGEITTEISPKVDQLILTPNRSTAINWIMKIGGIATVNSTLDRSPKVKFINSANEVVGETTASYG